MEPTLELSEVGESRLDLLVADFAAHVARLAALDVETVTNAAVVIELRDNAYPSLLALAEEIRELDAELAELGSPEPGLDAEHAVALAAALRTGHELSLAARAALSEIPSEEVKTTLEAHAARFEATARVATAVLHQVVVVDDELVGANKVGEDA